MLSTHRNTEGTRATAECIRATGGEVAVFDADISSEADVERLVEATFAQAGGVDVWVNNAGGDILTGAGARLSDLAKLDLVLGVDLRGTALCSWRVAERLRAQGRGVILNLSWDHVLVGAPGREAEIYAAAKGGVLAFSKCLARSFAPEVRVAVLAPGWIATAFAETLPPEERSRIAASTPMERWGTPEDVAEAAVFLASSQADFLTGTTLLVNGGGVM